MALEIHELTSAGHIKKLSYFIIAKWIIDLWNDIDTILIHKFFKYYKVLLARDGNEDHLLFNYDSLNKKKKNNEGNNIYNKDELETEESDNESKNDLPLDDLKFNEYDSEELPNYKNI